MKVTIKGQVTIPPAIRKKHGFHALCEVEFVDQPNGVLLVKAGKPLRRTRIVTTMLRGGKIKARTDEWLKLTRGDE
jgi:bifunctional DNA-binding transcriptional regulator/antitoxin component of YhaV-PrlF toxin-antitoxin module